MSPNKVFPLDMTPENSITERILQDPNITFDVADGALVIAIKAELLVRKSARTAFSDLHRELSKVASHVGNLADIDTARPSDSDDRGKGQPSVATYQPDEGGPAGNIEIWRLTDPAADSIDEARRLRALAKDEPVSSSKGPELVVPAVSPNHVSILSPKADGCPAGPPHPTPPRVGEFIEPLAESERAKVVVLDSGYIESNGARAMLDERVTSVAGQWLDTATATWQLDPPDGLYTDADGALDGIVGHGTFIAGLIAHICPEAEITVVGQRDQEVQIGPLKPGEQSLLFATEAAIAHSMLLYCDTDVIQCGFSFPTLDDYASIPFVAVMQVLTSRAAPREGVAVVAPAGNEESDRRYWPAALPDVIGVAATNRRGRRRAYFSNWGDWCDGCTRGQDVFSTFIYWDGPIEGEPLTSIEQFSGWARWDGTSFAAPKVAAAIAKLVAESEGAVLPVDAFDLIVRGATEVVVTPLTDTSLTPSQGVTLPYLHLG